MYDDAVNTLNAAISMEPENELLTKQLKAVRSKKAAAAAKAQRPRKTLNDAQKKEMGECQENGNKLTRDLRQVSSRLGSCQRDIRANAVTAQQIKDLTPGVTTYRTVGKAFFLTPRDEIESRLVKENETLNKNQSDFADRKVYLERRIESNTQHMRDVMGNM
jgi:chaperonin cofactor prefoldin